MPHVPETSSDDTVKHAPESGEPTETGRIRDGNPDTAAHTEKSPPGKPELGEDFESGRADAVV